MSQTSAGLTCTVATRGTHLSVTACMNSSIRLSYSFPLILLCFSPMYSGSSSSAWTHGAHS